MLIKDILKKVNLNVYLPNNLLNEDLEDVSPKDYVKTGNKYIIRFNNSTFQITIDLDNVDEYLVMSESFDDIRDIYVSYTIEGHLYCLS